MMDLEVRDENCSMNESGCGLSASPAGVSTALASVLIFTIVVDILGNVLVILSVYRNKKLRNAGESAEFKTSCSVSKLFQEASSSANWREINNGFIIHGN